MAGFGITRFALAFMLAMGAAILSVASVQAAQITQVGSSILLSGEIQKGDLEALTRKVSDAQLGGATALTLLLNSEGGSFEESLRLANFVNASALPTRVAKGSKCLSACAIVFLGGTSRGADEAQLETSRTLEVGAELGFHLPYAAPGDGASPEKLKLDETEAAFRLSKVFEQYAVPRALWTSLLKNDASHSLFDATSVEVTELLNITVDGMPEFKLPVTRQMAENICINGLNLSQRKLPSLSYEKALAEIDGLIRTQPISRSKGEASDFLLLPVTRMLSENGVLEVVTCRVSNDAACQGLFWPDAVKVNTDGETPIEALDGCQGSGTVPLAVPPTTRLSNVAYVLELMAQTQTALLRQPSAEPVPPDEPEAHEPVEPDTLAEEPAVPPPLPAPSTLAVPARAAVVCNANQSFANVRAGPNSQQFHIVATLPNQTSVTVVGETRNPASNHPWYEITYSAGKGFIDAELVQPTCLIAMPPKLPPVPEQPAGREVVVCNAKGDSANLRNTPNPKASVVLRKLFNHEKLEILGEANNPDSGHLYFRVTAQGAEGFVDSELVSPSCSLTPAFTPTVATELPTEGVVCNSKFPITNLRSGPNPAQFGVLLELRNNTPVELLSRTSNPVTGSPWLEVIAQGTRGFVDASNIASDCTGVVPVLAVKMICNRSLAVTNMRSGPNKNYALISALANNTRAEVLETVNNPETGHPWVKIRANGVEGYVDSDLVADGC